MSHRTELIDRIAKEARVTKTTAAVAYQALIDSIANAVIAGERVTLTGLGTFERSLRPARTARNPLTGASIAVPERYIPRFKPSKTLKDAMPAVKKAAKGKK